VRFVYNFGLVERTKAFRAGSRMNFAQSSLALTKLKQTPEHAWLNEVSSVPTQQALRCLQTAFVNFFDKRAAYPTFKRKTGTQSAIYTRSAMTFDAGTRNLKLAFLGHLRVKWSRPMGGINPSSVTVIRKPSGRYFVSMVVDVATPQFAKTGAEVGVDFGITRLATLSTGERIPNPKHGQQQQARVAQLQRAVARKRKGSQRRHLAACRLARAQERVADCRRDTINKLARNLVSRFDVIYLEDLNLRGMVKNHALARTLSDTSIGASIRTIETKAAMHGKATVKIDRWFPSSKMCSVCGVLQSKMSLGIRRWTCECGAVHDRDENAAKNILAVGQTVSAHGGGVRLRRATARRSDRLRSANQPRSACA
jgi:putative transposase